MEELHHILKAGSPEELLEVRGGFLRENSGWCVVFERYFLSDPEQICRLPQGEGAVSYIVQPPADGSRIAVWLYMVRDADVRYGSGLSAVTADGAGHIWMSGMCSSGADSYIQTRGIFEDYARRLGKMGCTISGNCARTWIFVDDIDHNYQGMVRSRRGFFDRCGLTRDTHYVASTGICGRPLTDGAVVQMDAYATTGDVTHRYLYAGSHMNRTSDYGVTFERGVRLDYSGMSHLLVSGTASIDNQGQVVHVGDVCAQTGRMLENVGALLEEGGCGWSDLKVALIYLRHGGDCSSVLPVLSERLGATPFTVVLAPVCRPQWLIEMECIAIK